MFDHTQAIGSAVHNKSTGSENCCETQRRQRTFYARLSPICGAQEIQVVAGQSVKLRVPVSFGGLLLQDSKDSLARKDFAQAQEYTVCSLVFRVKPFGFRFSL